MADLKIQGEVSLDATDAEQAISRVDAGARKMAQSVARSGKVAADGMAAVGASSKGAADSINREEGRMRASIKRATFDLETLGKTMSQKFEAKISMQGLDAAKFAPYIDKLREAERAQQAVSAAAGNTSDSLMKVAVASAAAFAGSALTARAVAATKALYDASSAAERFRTTLDFATGGTGAKELVYLRGVTHQLGLQFSTTAAAYASFQAAAKGTALEGQKAREVFESIAKASAVMGLSADQSSGVLLALQQMISKGTVQAEELRGQLGERLPGAFQVAAKAMGVTTAELGKMLEQGQVIADDFLPKFARALEENLGGSAEKAADRLDASVNRLNNAWGRLKQNTGDSGVSSFMAGQYTILADAFSNISESMEKARSNGGGFAAQMLAAGGAVLEFANPLNALTYSAQSNAESLRFAEARLAEMQRSAKAGIDVQVQMGRLEELIAKLRAAKREQDALNGGAAPDPRDRSGFTSRGQSYEQEEQRLRGIESAMGKVVGKLSGVKDTFYKDLNSLYAGYQAGLMSLSDYQDRVAKLIKEDGVEKPDRSGASATKAQESAYATLIASIKSKIAQNKEEFEWSGRLTEADKLRIKMMEELNAGSRKMTAAQRADALAQLSTLDKQEREKNARQQAVALYREQSAMAEELAQAEVANSRAREQGSLAVTAYGKSIQDANDAFRFELSLMGKSEEARERALAQYRIELELKQQLDAIDRNAGFGPADREREAARARAGAGSALDGLAMKAELDAIKELNDYLDPARAQDFGSALADAFGAAGNSLARLTNSLQSYGRKEAQLAKQRKNVSLITDEKERAKQTELLNQNVAQAQISHYADMAGAAKGFFSEHSKGYQAVEAAEKAFRIAELGMSLQTGLMKAKEAIATQASGGDPYTAFARMAAMTAAMAALGFAVSGSGGGSSSAVREQRQRTQGTGTVFGDKDAKSGSLGNAFDLLEDSAKMELRYQSGMLAALRNIENSMAGVANAVLRTAGITSGNATGVIEGVLSTNKGDPILNAIGLGPLASMASNLPLIGGVIGKLQSLWGKTKQEIVDSGLTIDGAVAALMSGQGFGSYTDIKRTKSSFFGLSKSTSYRTQFGELDEGTEDALARVFRNLSSTLVLASGAFGRDAEQVGKQIAATVINIPRVSLRDLKGEDLQEAITSTISAAADTIGKTVTPGLEDFQQVGEGYFETIIRVSSGIESADYALERFGIGAIAFQQIASKQGDVAAEIFRDSVSQFEGAGKGITQIIQGVAGSVDDLADTYRDLIAVRNSLKSVGANGSDPTFDLLRGAGGVEALQDGLDAYLEGFFSETERYASASARLSEQFAQIGVAQPQDIASFRALANSLDLTDSASAQLFGRLMNVAEAFYDVASAVEASERNLKEAFDDVAADWLDADDLRAYRATRISEGLGEVGLTISPAQILGASAEQFKDMYYAIDRTTMAGREQATALLDVWGAFQEMNKAAEEAKTAWQGLADSIVDEIKRIRGEMAGNEQQGMAQAQAEFAIATAKARAGDESAAGDLPTLSRAVLDLAKKTATSATELKLFQGQIAASLAETTKQIAASQGVTVPAFASGGTHAGGWALVGERGPELVNLPPSRVFSASQSATMMGNTERLESEVMALREDLRNIGGELARLQLRNAKASEATARVLDDVTEGGTAMRTAD